MAGNLSAVLPACAGCLSIYGVERTSIGTITVGPQKGGGVDAENLCQTGNHIDGCAVLASLQCADIGSMNVGAVRQFFLRIASGVSQRAQVERENVPNIHKRMSADRRAFLYRVCSADDVAARSRNLSLNCCGHADMRPPSSRNGLRSEKRADRRSGSPSSASGPPHVTAYPLRQLPYFQEDHRRLPTTLARGPSGAYGFGSLLTIMAVLQCNRAAPHSRFRQHRNPLSDGLLPR